MIVLVALALAACPVLDPAPEVVYRPKPRAVALNNEGKALYRQGRFDEAAAKYQAAAFADPQWIAPVFNRACALARHERYGAAADAAADVVRRAYVPWGREVLESADLAVLHPRPEMAKLRTAVAAAAAAWGDGAGQGLLFVARTRPPVRLAGDGVLALGLQQEIFAWLPATGRTLQVTAEDGRVLALAQSHDRRKVVYVRAGRLVRPAGGTAFLRGLSLRTLDLTSMAPGPPTEVEGDVLRLALSFSGAAAELQVVSSTKATRQLWFDGVSLRPSPSTARSASGVVLTASGVEQAARVRWSPPCAFHASDDRPPDGSLRIRMRAGSRDLAFPTPHGAGLFGLPFPR